MGGGGLGEEEEGAVDAPGTSRSKAERNRMRTSFSEVGANFLALCSHHGESEFDLRDWVGSSYPDQLGAFDHFIRDGRRPRDSLRDVLVEYSKEKFPSPLNRAWFDGLWHPSTLIDSFRSANSRYGGIIEEICGTYTAISPMSLQPDAASPENGEGLKDCVIAVQKRADGVAQWHVKGAADTTPSREGFVMCCADTFFFVGMDRHKHNLSLHILRRPDGALAEIGVRLLGLYAGTISSVAVNARAVAKRTLFVEHRRWVYEWNSGATIPEGARSWLLDDGPGLNLNLFTEEMESEL